MPDLVLMIPSDRRQIDNHNVPCESGVGRQEGTNSPGKHLQRGLRASSTRDFLALSSGDMVVSCLLWNGDDRDGNQT